MQKLFVIFFVVINLVLPFTLGEWFPFTTAPMFRDHPKLYCDFRVTSPDGKILPLDQFGLQRNYDGNPVAYGSGRLPAETLDRFGDDTMTDKVVPSREELQQWIGDRLLGKPWPYVTVTVTVWGPVQQRIDVRDESYQMIVVKPEGSPIPGNPIPGNPVPGKITAPAEPESAAEPTEDESSSP